MPEPKISTGDLNDNFQFYQFLAPETQQKVRELDILISKSPIGTASLTKNFPINVSPAAPPMFNHMNSKKRKGIPRRAPLS